MRPAQLRCPLAAIRLAIYRFLLEKHDRLMTTCPARTPATVRDPNSGISVALELPDPAATDALAQRVAWRLMADRVSTCIGLSGDLGAGKTHFARALIRALPLADGQLDPQAEVPSPTYTLLQAYERQIGWVWHFDAYRLSSEAELDELGWQDILGEAALLLVEWPERLGSAWPASSQQLRALWLAFKTQGEGRRLDWPAAQSDWLIGCTSLAEATQ